ncbi:hypothetical protein Tco_0535000 [Tanacetum coccineum]
MSNQTNELKNMMASFFQMNTASSSGSGSLPSNTVANPRGDLKAITTRSGISYDGPPIPPLPKVVEREPEVTKDTVQPSTENIQPPLVQIQAPIDEPVSAPKPKPRVMSTLDDFGGNLDCQHGIGHVGGGVKDCEVFGVLWEVNELVECLALADLGASINLMPLSIWKKLSLPDLTPTQMILELPDRSILSIEGDLFTRRVINDDPSSPLPPKELNLEELKIVKSSIDDPPEGFTFSS